MMYSTCVFCGTLSETPSALSMNSFLTAKSHKLCKLSWKDWFAAKADFSLAFPQHTQCIQTGHARIMNKNHQYLQACVALVQSSSSNQAAFFPRHPVRQGP